MIEISLNNEKTMLPTDTSLATALATWRYKQQSTFAVAVNQVFVARDNYQQTTLNDQDQVDIVQPISGG